MLFFKSFIETRLRAFDRLLTGQGLREDKDDQDQIDPENVKDRGA